jgi:hydroxycarboxylate dehydrogenase B
MNSFFMMAICVGSMRELTDFSKVVRDFAAYVKDSEPMQSGGEVMLPYEPELRERQRRRAEGIPIDDNTWKEIVEVAESLGVRV